MVSMALSLNSIQDKDVDSMMQRTKFRPLVTNEISLFTAYLLTFSLLLISFVFMLFIRNFPIFLIMLIGVFIYNFFYTPLKKKFLFGYFIGFFAGMVPPLIGFLATSSKINVYHIYVFTFFVLWQILHTLVIHKIYLEDFQRAKLPLFPFVKDNHLLKIIFYLLTIVISIPISIFFLYKGIYAILFLDLLFFLISFHFINRNKEKFFLKVLNFYLLFICLLSVYERYIY